MLNTNKKVERKKHVYCHKCKTQADCCRFGAWADLEEAKKIITLGLKGEFSQLEKDDDFPSGYKLGTSHEDCPCTFLDPDGLCSIHKIEYNLKPESCKEFPYEDNKVSPYADILCTILKAKAEKKKKK